MKWLRDERLVKWIHVVISCSHVAAKAPWGYVRECGASLVLSAFRQRAEWREPLGCVAVEAVMCTIVWWWWISVIVASSRDLNRWGDITSCNCGQPWCEVLLLQNLCKTDVEGNHSEWLKGVEANCVRKGKKWTVGEVWWPADLRHCDVYNASLVWAATVGEV